MPRVPVLRLRLDLPFREALRQLVFFYLSHDHLRVDEVESKLLAFEDYIRKWDSLTRKLARGVTFHLTGYGGEDLGILIEPDAIIEKYQQGHRITMTGLENQGPYPIRWSG